MPKKPRIEPSDGQGRDGGSRVNGHVGMYGITNPGYLELQKIKESKKTAERSETEVARERALTMLSIDQWQSVTQPVVAKQTVSKWQDYVCKKRKMSLLGKKIYREGPAPKCGLKHQKTYEYLNATHQGIDSDVDDNTGQQSLNFDYSLSDTGSGTIHDKLSGLDKFAVANSRALIIYFSKLAGSDNEDDEIDFEFVSSLLKSGADINATDRHGQTIFHEVARAWHVDAAMFLLEQNGDINKPDKFGRTPLHVASAVDYADMVKFLVEHGANLHATTFGELQTPIHYAAKNDATLSLKMLIKLGANVNNRDYKERTPLQVAAELDRSEAAKYLVEQGVPVGVCDSSCLSIMTLMIEKMPLVAKRALDQFHTTDRANRKQYFYLNYLEPKRPGQTIFAKQPMECAVESKQMELLLHPAFRRLIQVKWSRFGLYGCVKNTIIQIIFVLLWTAIGISIPRDGKYYEPIKDRWWEVALDGVAVFMTVLFIVQELWEFRSSSQSHKQWKEWRTGEIRKDLRFCHPRWPEEKKYIMQEIERIENSSIAYFKDSWNYLDWITYIWILAVVISRIVAMGTTNKTVDGLHPKLLAISLIFIWVRLMKVMRAFQALGPFITMIGHIIDDTLKFCFLYLEIFIPYVCAFWILFGGELNAKIMKSKGQSSSGWKDLNDLMYSVWLITVVGDFPWEPIAVVDRIMAQLFVGTFIALSGLVMINLFIALMSDTFQRVYDNAKANAVMQQTSTILSLEDGLSRRKRDRFRCYIHNKCSPEQIYYDDDDTEEGGELEKMTIQIKEVVDEIDETIKTSLDNGGIRKAVETELNTLKQETVSTLQTQDKIIRNMDRKIDELATLVNELLNRTAPLNINRLPPPSSLSSSFRTIEAPVNLVNVEDDRTAKRTLSPVGRRSRSGSRRSKRKIKLNRTPSDAVDETDA